MLGSGFAEHTHDQEGGGGERTSTCFTGVHPVCHDQLLNNKQVLSAVALHALKRVPLTC